MIFNFVIYNVWFFCNHSLVSENEHIPMKHWFIFWKSGGASPWNTAIAISGLWPIECEYAFSILLTDKSEGGVFGVVSHETEPSRASS